MKDFDELLSPDRTFKVKGEVFTWHDVRPEVLTLFEFPFPEENGKATSAKAKEELDKRQKTYAWDLADAQIKIFLSESDRERWDQLRAREENPIPIKQINALLEWLMEEQTNRPTQPPSPSEAGRGRTAPSSTAE